MGEMKRVGGMGRESTLEGRKEDREGGEEGRKEGRWHCGPWMVSEKMEE